MLVKWRRNLHRKREKEEEKEGGGGRGGKRGKEGRNAGEKKEKRRERARTMFNSGLPWMRGNYSRQEGWSLRKWMDLICVSLRKANITEMLADRHWLPNRKWLPDILCVLSRVCQSEWWGGRALLGNREKIIMVSWQRPTGRASPGGGEKAQAGPPSEGSGNLHKTHKALWKWLTWDCLSQVTILDAMRVGRYKSTGLGVRMPGLQSQLGFWFIVWSGSRLILTMDLSLSV